MNARGKRVALDEAAVGATLALDVCDAGGQTLLAAGAQLSAAAVASLGKRGITHVHVAELQSADDLAAQRAAVLERLDHLFRRAQGNALMARLHDVILAFRLEQLR